MTPRRKHFELPDVGFSLFPRSMFSPSRSGALAMVSPIDLKVTHTPSSYRYSIAGTDDQAAGGHTGATN